MSSLLEMSPAVTESGEESDGQSESGEESDGHSQVTSLVTGSDGVIKSQVTETGNLLGSSRVEMNTVLHPLF